MMPPSSWTELSLLLHACQAIVNPIASIIQGSQQPDKGNVLICPAVWYSAGLLAR